MTQRKPPRSKLTTTHEAWPGLAQDQVSRTVHRSGLARLSALLIYPAGPHVSNPGQLPPERHDYVGLAYQYMREPEADHGLASTYRVLHDEGHGCVKRRTSEELEADLARCLGPEAWARIKAGALDQFNMTEAHDNWRVLLIAFWAEHLAEPLSPVWLAAMAQHAYYLLDDDFAFGYLTALLDQRLTNEEHFERGAKAVESAALGGRARAADARGRRAAILADMARLVDKGHSVSRAAELAHDAGQGTSAEANRRLWVRYGR